MRSWTAGCKVTGREESCFVSVTVAMFAWSDWRRHGNPSQAMHSELRYLFANHLTFYLGVDPFNKTLKLIPKQGCPIISSTLLMQYMMRRLYSVDGDLNECVWCSYRVDGDISEIHASIFEAAVCRVREFLCIYGFISQKQGLDSSGHCIYCM